MTLSKILMTKVIYLIKIKKVNPLMINFLIRVKLNLLINVNNQPINFIAQNNNNSNDQHQKKHPIKNISQNIKISGKF